MAMAVTTPEQEQMAALAATFGDPTDIEPLCDELKAHSYDDDDLGTCIKHPLYFQLMHHDALNRFVNKQFALKREAAEELLAAGEFRQWLWLHERPYRFDAFQRVADRLSDHHYWQTLGDLWTDTENQHQNLRGWHDALMCGRPRRWAIMDKGERDKLKSMRGCPVLVYRGYCKDGCDRGLSWTLSRKTADWFARRLAIETKGDRPRTVSGIVDHQHIIAYIGRRNEEEIVLLPEHVHVVRTERVP